MENKYDVFISYSTQDQKLLEHVCGHLEQKGYRCFLAYRDIPHGVDWDSAIMQALNQSSMMVTVLSDPLKVSPQTQREMGMATERQMPIHSCCAADFDRAGEDGLNQLLHRVMELIGPSIMEQEKAVQMEAERQAKEDAEKARMEEEQRQKEENERKAVEEAERKAKEEPVTKVEEEPVTKAEEETVTKAGEETVTKTEEETGQKAPGTVEQNQEAHKQKVYQVKPKQKRKVWPWIVVGLLLAMLIVLSVLLARPKRNPPPWPPQPDTLVNSVDTVVEQEPPVTPDPNDLVFTVNGISFTMKYVEGGTFWMGAQNKDPNAQNYDSDANNREKPVHSVTVSSFYMAETELTQALWVAVMGSSSNPSQNEGDNLPVEHVSHDEIVNVFLPKLNQLTGVNFRLPTEAEWEFAARGGNRSKGYKYAGSNNIEEVAWYWRNSGDNYLNDEVNEEDSRGANIISEKARKNNCKTHAVKGKLPNELGLYDMSGNVTEWCYDWYEEDYYRNCGDFMVDPKGPVSSDRSNINPTSGFFVHRGGNNGHGAKDCRVSCRGSGQQSANLLNFGFRLAMQPPASQTGSNDPTGSVNGHDYVDLGLPSGTLWATCNIGASKPEDYGNFYAWGETQTKSVYNLENYKYAKGSSEGDPRFTKYCSVSRYGNNGFTDNLTVLLPEDDAATVNWGSGWRTPSDEQWEELLQNTTNRWTTQNGVSGYLFTATNGRKLFLPAAGCNIGERCQVEIDCYYWSRSLIDGSDYYACSYDGTSDAVHHLSAFRDMGFSIRPVLLNP